MTTTPRPIQNEQYNIEKIVSYLEEYAQEAADGAASDVTSLVALRKTTNQAIPSNVPSGGYHKVTWPTVAFESGDAISWDNVNHLVSNTSGGTIVVKVDARIGWSDNNGNGRWLAIMKTVGASTTIELAESGHGSPSLVSQSISSLVELPSGASLYVGAAQNTGSSLNIAGMLTSSGGTPNALSVEVVSQA